MRGGRGVCRAEPYIHGVYIYICTYIYNLYIYIYIYYNHIYIYMYIYICIYIYIYLRRGGTKASACFLTRAGARETPPHPYGMAQT